MGLSNNISLYEDVRRVMDAALKAGGGVYELASPAAATHFRHRMYHYRKLLLTHYAQQFPGQIAKSPYDTLVFQIEGSKIIITSRINEGTFSTPAGKIIPLTDDADPLMEAARSAALRLKEGK